MAGSSPAGSRRAAGPARLRRARAGIHGVWVVGSVVPGARRRLVSACCAAAAQGRDGHGGAETLRRDAQPSRVRRERRLVLGRGGLVPVAAVAGPARLRRARAGILGVWVVGLWFLVHVAGWCRRGAQQRRTAETVRPAAWEVPGSPSRVWRERRPVFATGGLLGRVRRVGRSSRRRRRLGLVSPPPPRARPALRPRWRCAARWAGRSGSRSPR